MRTLIFSVLAVASVLAMPRDARAQSDERFAASVAETTEAHVVLGELALQISTDEPTRAFARQLVDDSKRINADLATSARSASIELPADLPPRKVTTAETLSTLRDVEFDAQFAKVASESTAALLRSFTEASQSVGDARLKSFATANLQVLQAHLDAANALRGDATGESG